MAIGEVLKKIGLGLIQSDIEQRKQKEKESIIEETEKKKAEQREKAYIKEIKGYAMRTGLGTPPSELKTSDELLEYYTQKTLKLKQPQQFAKQEIQKTIDFAWNSLPDIIGNQEMFDIAKENNWIKPERINEIGDEDWEIDNIEVLPEYIDKKSFLQGTFNAALTEKTNIAENAINNMRTLGIEFDPDEMRQIANEIVTPDYIEAIQIIKTKNDKTKAEKEAQSVKAMKAIIPMISDTVQIYDNPLDSPTLKQYYNQLTPAMQKEYIKRYKNALLEQEQKDNEKTTKQIKQMYKENKEILNTNNYNDLKNVMGKLYFIYSNNPDKIDVLNSAFKSRKQTIQIEMESEVDKVLRQVDTSNKQIVNEEVKQLLNQFGFIGDKESEKRIKELINLKIKDKTSKEINEEFKKLKNISAKYPLDKENINNIIETQKEYFKTASLQEKKDFNFKFNRYLNINKAINSIKINSFQDIMLNIFRDEIPGIKEKEAQKDEIPIIESKTEKINELNDEKRLLYNELLGTTLLMRKRKESIIRIKTDEDYDKLKSGTPFIDPNGILRRKP